VKMRNWRWVLLLRGDGALGRCKGCHCMVSLLVSMWVLMYTIVLVYRQVGEILHELLHP
jgi:hypothetical protein